MDPQVTEEIQKLPVSRRANSEVRAPSTGCVEVLLVLVWWNQKFREKMNLTVFITNKCYVRKY